MADVHSLRDSITEVDETEALDMILKIREQRRENRRSKRSRSKSKKSKSKSKSKKKAKNKEQLISMISGLSKKDAEIMMNKLKN